MVSYLKQGFNTGIRSDNEIVDSDEDDHTDGHGHGTRKVLQIVEHVHRAIIQDVARFDGPMLTTVQGGHGDPIHSVNISSLSWRNNDGYSCENKVDGDATNRQEGETLHEEEAESMKGESDKDCGEWVVGSNSTFGIVSNKSEDSKATCLKDNDENEQSDLTASFHADMTAVSNEQNEVKDGLMNEMCAADIQQANNSSDDGQINSLEKLTFSSPRSDSTRYNYDTSVPNSSNLNVSTNTNSSCSHSPEDKDPIKLNIEKMKEEKRLADIVAVITHRRIAEEKKKHASYMST